MYLHPLHPLYTAFSVQQTHPSILFVPKKEVRKNSRFFVATTSVLMSMCGCTHLHTRRWPPMPQSCAWSACRQGQTAPASHASSLWFLLCLRPSLTQRIPKKAQKKTFHGSEETQKQTQRLNMDLLNWGTVHGTSMPCVCIKSHVKE